MCAQRRLRSSWASGQSDQSLRCLHVESLGPRLIWVFTGRTCHFVGFVTMRLIYTFLRGNKSSRNSLKYQSRTFMLSKDIALNCRLRTSKYITFYGMSNQSRPRFAHMILFFWNTTVLLSGHQSFGHVAGQPKRHMLAGIYGLTWGSFWGSYWNKNIRPKKYICVFQVSRPYLGFWPDPKHFIVLKKKKKKIYIYIYIYIR